MNNNDTRKSSLKLNFPFADKIFLKRWLGFWMFSSSNVFLRKQEASRKGEGSFRAALLFCWWLL